MTGTITRRKLVGTTSAAVAATTIASSPVVFAQDELPSVSVGTRPFTEQLILGEFVSQLLENDGFPVERNFNLGGSMVSQEALLAGEIDTLVEYTGTALIVMLGQELPEREAGAATATPSDATPGASPVAGGSLSDQVYDIVSETYPDEFGLEFLERWGFANNYALAMRRDHAEELGVTRTSDLAPMAGDLTIGTEAEAAVREDGVPGLEEAYGFEFDSITTLDAGLMYTAVAEGEVDVITAYTTDGRINSMDLVLLEDDLEFFPPYDAAPVVRIDKLEEAPGIRDCLNQMAGKISNEQMMEMNYQADEEGVEHSEIVRNFLVEAGIVQE